jgi:hypothetical protein
MGLAHVALQAGHRDVAAWLAEHGAPCDPLLAYGLGGTAGLAAHPDIDERFEPSGRTILHQAVEARDTALLEAALALGADVGVRDRQFGATPLEWALQLGNEAALAVLKR